jgi:hypothetical protein
MTKELIDKQKSLLRNIEEIKQSHAIILQDHLQPPTLEKLGNNTPPNTAFPTPNITYENQIKNTVLHRKYINDAKE